VIDPLDRRRDEKCGCEEWIRAIKALTPLVNHKSIFNTVLTGADKLKLNEVSKQISEDIHTPIAVGKIDLAVVLYRVDMGKSSQKISRLFSSN